MMNNRQKLLQIAEDLGEPRRSIVLACVAEMNEMHQRKAEMFAELEQVKKVANDLAATVDRLKTLNRNLVNAWELGDDGNLVGGIHRSVVAG